MVLELLKPYNQIMGQAYVDFYEQCSTEDAYASMLQQTYYCVRETVPAITSVLRKCPDHPLLAAMEKNCREETGHDQMLLDDLRVLGRELDESPSPQMQEYVKLAQSLSSEADPVSALYGHVAVLDCHPRKPKEVEVLIAMFGVSADAASCFIEHAIVDHRHRVEAIRAMEHPSIDTAVVLERAVVICKLFFKHWKWMSHQHTSAEG